MSIDAISRHWCGETLSLTTISGKPLRFKILPAYMEYSNNDYTTHIEGFMEVMNGKSDSWTAYKA